MVKLEFLGAFLPRQLYVHDIHYGRNALLYGPWYPLIWSILGIAVYFEYRLYKASSINVKIERDSPIKNGPATMRRLANFKRSSLTFSVYVDNKCLYLFKKCDTTFLKVL